MIRYTEVDGIRSWNRYDTGVHIRYMIQLIPELPEIDYDAAWICQQGAPIDLDRYVRTGLITEVEAPH